MQWKDMDCGIIARYVRRWDAAMTTTKARKPRTKLRDTDLSTDIAYRGPLSYRSFKAIGWLCIVFAQVAIVMSLGIEADATMAEKLMTPQMVFNALG